MKLAGLICAGFFVSSPLAVTITETEILYGGVATEALGVWAVPGHNDFLAFRNVSNSSLYLGWYPLPTGATTVGSYGYVYRSTFRQLLGRYSASNAATGQGYVVAKTSVHKPNSTVTLSDPSGPLFAIEDGVSVDVNGLSHTLFEVRPATGPRKVYIHRYRPGSLNTHQSFALPDGARILDCDRQAGGGLVFLAGTPDQASTYVVSPSGLVAGPFPVGAASQILWSPAGGGTVHTAGATPAGMFFTSGPLNGPYDRSVTEPMTLLSTAFEFTCGAINDSGTIWWGGTYTSTLGNQNGFISGLNTEGTLDPVSTQVAGAESFDEQVFDVAVTDHGISMWTETGSMGLFNTKTGELIQAHPPTPNANVDYRGVAPLDASGNRIKHAEYAVIGYDRVQMRSWRTLVSLRGDLNDAILSASTVTGGLPIRVYGRLYGHRSGTTHAITYSASEVSGPSTMSFNGTTGHVQLQTVPVHEPVEVTVSLGNGFPKEVNKTFTILPPAPRFFTPASQTVRGGTTIVSRLTLTGKAPTGGLTVALASDGPEAQVASSFIVPEGLWSRSFVIRTSPVTSSLIRSVTATYNGISQSTSITLTP